jgi:hypothetical protein
MKKYLAMLIFGAALAAGPASAQVSIRVGPPPPRVERRPPPPGRRYVWVGGYHRWDRGRYVWVPGSYVLPPRPGLRWVPGRWEHRRDSWYWRDGRWR